MSFTDTSPYVHVKCEWGCEVTPPVTDPEQELWTLTVDSVKQHELLSDLIKKKTSHAKMSRTRIFSFTMSSKRAVTSVSLRVHHPGVDRHN